MKLINKSGIKRRRQEAGWLVAIIAILAIAALVLYVGYKVITHLLNHPVDPNHGHPDPEEQEEFTAWKQQMEEQYGPVHIKVPGYGHLPIEAFSHDWYYTVETSSNLVNWTEVPLEWSQITNDLSKPAIFYRTVLHW